MILVAALANTKSAELQMPRSPNAPAATPILGVSVDRRIGIAAGSRLRRCTFACLAVAVGLSLPAPAIALTQQQIDQCINKDNAYSPALVIDACTVAIESGRWR